MKDSSHVIVVGAGISGLSCAGTLKREGIGSIVLEKSRSLGGRCATRRWRNHRVDHGAQYVTARNPDFLSLLSEKNGWQTLKPELFDFDGQLPSDDSPRFYHEEGNNTLGRQLAAGLDVRLETQVESVESLLGGGWKVNGLCARAVVLSVPAPQAERILGQEVGEWTMVPCLTALCAYTGKPSGMAARRYAISRDSDMLPWSACENHKAKRVAGEEQIFVLQASAEFSQKYLEEPHEVWASILRARAEEIWELNPATHLETWTHRWRYARYTQPLSSPASLPQGIFLTGDMFRKSRVEDAWLAGCETASRVIEYLAS